MNIAISYGSYYNYLMDKTNIGKQFICDAKVQVFNDKELATDFSQSIRGKTIFIFGDTVHNLHELIMTIDAAKRSAVKKIVVVLPYFGYSRQDQQGTGRACIGGAVIANILAALGVNHLISIDLHAAAIKGFFPNPFDHLSGRHLFVPYIKSNFDITSDNLTLWAPDAGGTKRVKKFADELNLPYGIIDKTRKQAGVIGSMTVIGDPEGKDIITIDDICDTAGTLIKSTQELKARGAKSVTNLITHPVFSNDAVKRINDSDTNLVVFNTRNTVVNLKSDNIKVIDCSDFLMEAIFNIANNKSISTTMG